MLLQHFSPFQSISQEAAVAPGESCRDDGAQGLPKPNVRNPAEPWLALNFHSSDPLNVCVVTNC